MSFTTLCRTSVADCRPPPYYVSEAVPVKNITWAVCLCLAASGVRCAPAPRIAPPASRAADRVPETPAPAPPPADLFAAAVRPVLASRCTPCHEPGGRMYGRMPFDSPEVVASHRAGILRRIKEPAERKALEDWLATLPPG
jgi:hypothetical protein